MTTASEPPARVPATALARARGGKTTTAVTATVDQNTAWPCPTVPPGLLRCPAPAAPAPPVADLDLSKNIGRSAREPRVTTLMRQDGNVMNVMSSRGDDEPRLIVVQSDRPPSEAGEGQSGDGDEGETLEKPGKVMRIGSMIRQLLEEVRQAPLDEASRVRLREIYDASLQELQEGLSPDLSSELARMAPPFHPEKVPTDAELRVAQAQLVGWLEGVFHGIQATLFAQQMAQRAQLEDARRRALPPGQADREEPPMPGNYL